MLEEVCSNQQRTMCVRLGGDPRNDGSNYYSHPYYFLKRVMMLDYHFLAKKHIMQVRNFTAWIKGVLALNVICFPIVIFN